MVKPNLCALFIDKLENEFYKLFCTML